MKLFTWNVNGIRSVHGKGFERWFQHEEPDVVCLQEVKAHPEQLEERVVHPEGYHSVWFPASKRGYSGVTIFTRHEPKAVELGMGDSQFDDEGRVASVDLGDFTVINAYFPNSQRDHARLDYKLAFCEAMRRKLDDFRDRGKHVVLCGDFNIAHREIDLRNPKQNVNNAGFLPQERAWMESLLQAGYIDTFRAFNPEGGHYTWWSYRPGVREKNIGWRLDYFVCNPEFRDRLSGADHYPMVMGSDHCPVELRLKS